MPMPDAGAAPDDAGREVCRTSCLCAPGQENEIMVDPTNASPFRDRFTAAQFIEACSLLNLRPLVALSDPSRMLPSVISANLRDGDRFLRMVLREPPRSPLWRYNHDAAGLYLGAVFSSYALAMRRHMKIRTLNDARTDETDE
jgi:hypothetical protein